MVERRRWCPRLDPECVLRVIYEVVVQKQTIMWPGGHSNSFDSRVGVILLATDHPGSEFEKGKS
jgi:hypothetical protein